MTGQRTTPTDGRGLLAYQKRKGREIDEAVKLMKGEYCVRAIKEHNMDHGLIFCRTKLDCDNMERYFNYCGGGRNKNEQFSCVCLHGDRKPAERRDNLEKFKQKKI